MQEQDQPGGWEHRQQLRADAQARAGRAVQEMVAGSGGRTVHEIRSRSLTWPGATAAGPEPIACLEAALELERAAHAAQLDHIRRARQYGRSWYEIGQALGLHWAASANKEPLAVEAYDYALRYDQRSSPGPFTWICPSCQQTVTDRGPYGDPLAQQDGHTASCARWAAERTAGTGTQPG